MRFLLNTRHNDAGTRVCIYDLYSQLQNLGLYASLNNWSGYREHDVVVFMGYDHEIERARRDNSKIKIVLADPKLSSKEYIKAAKSADLLLVSSVEQRDVFLELNSNVLIHYMFPIMTEKPRTHSDSRHLVIAYHGNRVHLEAMCPILIPAIQALTRERNVEILCIYNIAYLGRANLHGLEMAGAKVIHVQWDEKALVDTLAQADIGIMPNELPIRQRQAALRLTAFDNGDYAYEPFDHLVRYKASANPGRLLPFVCAGLPVVADFSPSASQFIRDGDSGFIVSSPYGWYFALSRLSESRELRQSCADRLRERVISTQNQQTQRFLDVCRNLTYSKLPYIHGLPTREEEQKLFYDYARPQETPLRWFTRQLRRYRSR